jgi:hypothetical protein
MKTNIQQVKYNKNSNKPDKCTWYSWDEFCDECGKPTLLFETFITSTPPDTDRKDYCLDCIRKKLDSGLISK